MSATAHAKTAPFLEEHAHFVEHLEHARVAARELPALSIEERELVIARIVTFLRSELVPHAEAEEHTIYREVGKRLGNPWATAPMIFDHLLIRRRMHALEAADLADVDTLREHLIALHALVCSHFEKEEQLYLPLLDVDSEEAVHEIYDRLISYEHAHGRPYLR